MYVHVVTFRQHPYKTGYFFILFKSRFSTWVHFRLREFYAWTLTPASRFSLLFVTHPSNSVFLTYGNASSQLSKHQDYSKYSTQILLKRNEFISNACYQSKISRVYSDQTHPSLITRYKMHSCWNYDNIFRLANPFKIFRASNVNYTVNSIILQLQLPTACLFFEIVYPTATEVGFSPSLLKPFTNHSPIISQTIRQPRLQIMNDNLHLSKLDNTCIQHRQNRIINCQSFSVPPTLKATTPFQTVQHLQGLDKVRYTLVIVMMGGKEKVYHNGQMEGGSQTKSCSLKNGKFIYRQRC